MSSFLETIEDDNFASHFYQSETISLYQSLQMTNNQEEVIRIMVEIKKLDRSMKRREQRKKEEFQELLNRIKEICNKKQEKREVKRWYFA